MKRQRNEYEVIILGTGLAGLIAGTLLSKNNRSVLLLKEKDYHPSLVNKGYRFLPFSNFSEKRPKTAPIDGISQALNLPFLTGYRSEEGKMEGAKKKVAFQVILPKARVDLFIEPSLFQREWKREFPKEVTEIETFYAEMGHLKRLLKGLKTREGFQRFFPFQTRSLVKRFLPSGFIPEKRISNRLSFFSGEFRAFVNLQLLSLGNLCSNLLPVAVASHILFNELDEFTPHRLEEFILEQFLKSGGGVEEIDGVEEVGSDWRRGCVVSSKSLEGEQREFRADRLILNLPLHRFTNLMGKKGKRLLKWEKRIRPKYVLCPLFLGIREKVIPVGMKDFLVSILDMEKPFEGGNLLFLALSPKGDETYAPDGKRALTVESLIPVEKLDEHSLIENQKEVINHLIHLFPFLEEHIDFTDFNWFNEQVHRLSYPHFIYEATSSFRWREGVIPTRISKNLYFTGKENFPYLGLEGELLSGLIAGREVLKTYP